MRVLLLFFVFVSFISGDTPCIVQFDKDNFRIYSSNYLLCNCNTIRTIRDTTVLRQLFKPDKLASRNLSGLVAKSSKGWKLYQYWTVSSHSYANNFYLRKGDKVIKTPDADQTDIFYAFLTYHGFNPKKSRKITNRVRLIEKAYEASGF